jgi:ADP-heptose:LPS heptosyltransferase
MKILVIRFTSLGDLVTLEPTFRMIRHFFPEAAITFLTTGVGKGLFADTGYFDEYVLHQGVFASVSQLRKHEFDLVINLQCNKPSHYISMLIKKGRVVNKSKSLLQNLFKMKAHSKSYQELLAASGVDEERLNGYFSQIGTPKIALPVGECGMESPKRDNPLVAISTGTSERWLSKRWGVDRFNDLIGMLIQDNIDVVLVGTSLELGDASKICERHGERVVSFVDKTSLTELKYILNQADLFIGNDSGPTHIAAAVGTDTVTIFGSTDVKHCVKQMPYRGHHICLKPSDTITCHPCYKPKCPTEMECMASIGVDQVYQTATSLLKKEG